MRSKNQPTGRARDFSIEALRSCEIARHSLQELLNDLGISKRQRHQLSVKLLPQTIASKGLESSSMMSTIDINQHMLYRPPVLHDISFINLSLFVPGCIVCQVQFKHVYRDYIVTPTVLYHNNIALGTFLVTVSHLDDKYTDLGVVTEVWSVDEFLSHKQLEGQSLDEEENFIGTAIRVATAEETAWLPKKWEAEKPVLPYAQHIVEKLGLVGMCVYEVEFQFDGKVLYVYYTADGRVDYREFVAFMKAFTGVRVKMKKTNQCRKFIPRLFASVALATGELPNNQLPYYGTSGSKA